MRNTNVPIFKLLGCNVFLVFEMDDEKIYYLW